MDQYLDFKITVENKHDRPFIKNDDQLQEILLSDLKIYLNNNCFKTFKKLENNFGKAEDSLESD